MVDPPRPTNAEVLRSWAGAIALTRKLAADPSATLLSVLAANSRPDDLALIGEHERFTYAQLAERAGRYASWGLAQGLAPGDVVGLLMPNRPEYVAIWLGLAEIRCTVALLDTAITGDALGHAIRVSGATTLIVAGELCPRVFVLGHGTKVWSHGPPEGGEAPRLDLELLAAAGPIPAERRARARDVALLIATSGTTGLPKAARLRHARVLEWSGWFAGMMDATPADRLYDCLPLYHSVGGVVAVGAMLAAGGSVVIRPRFSASRFWAEVAAYDCTIFQYIGELCRYLLNAPEAPGETAHRLRLACGNGLRGEVWTAMQRRFAIPHVLEFYAATEGSVSLYNREGQPGAIGRVPGFLAHRFPLVLARCDPETGEPVRDADGLCVRCATDEAGEALGPAEGFGGYTDEAASSRKILRDVLAPGDAWFRTGDLMRRDRAGYFYFVDRMGDTFRWKGENVSTAQVAGEIARCPGVADAVVYGVAVPGMEGRCGMAAIVAGQGFSADELARHIRASLPDHAQPRFLRICPAIELTGTFKLKKAALAAQGTDAGGGGQVWFLDRLGSAPAPLDAGVRARIAAGLERL